MYVTILSFLGKYFKRIIYIICIYNFTIKYNIFLNFEKYNFEKGFEFLFHIRFQYTYDYDGHHYINNVNVNEFIDEKPYARQFYSSFEIVLFFFQLRYCTKLNNIKSR